MMSKWYAALFCLFALSHWFFECPFSTNPKSNVTKEIFDSFRKQGLWTGAYFSKPDWHSPYYWDPKYPPRDRNVNYEPEANPEKWNKYVEENLGIDMSKEEQINFGKIIKKESDKKGAELDAKEITEIFRREFNFR